MFSSGVGDGWYACVICEAYRFVDHAGLLFQFVFRIFVWMWDGSLHEDIHFGGSLWYAPCVVLRMFVMGVPVMLLMTWGGQTLGRRPSRIYTGS